MLIYLKQTIVLFVVALESMCNLVCNGDFQSSAVSLLTTYTDYMGRQLYKNSGVATSSSCWTTTDFGRFSWEIKQVQKSNLAISRVANLMSSSSLLPSSLSYSLCQNLNLIIGKNYSLSFNYLIDQAMTSGTLKVGLNSTTIYGTTLADSYLSLGIELNITANASVYMLCFQDTNLQFKGSASYSNKLYLGSMIDNVTLIQITSVPNTTTQANTSNQTNTTNLNTSSSTNTTNITNASNMTANESNLTSASANTTNSTSRNSLIEITITFTIHCTLIQNNYNFISDFNPFELGLTPQYFGNLEILANQLYLPVAPDIGNDNLLFLTITPLTHIQLEDIKKSLFLFPDTQRQVSGKYLLVFKFDSAFITYQSFSSLQNKFINMADKSAIVFVQKLYSAFIIMSSSSLTSLILGLIGFYNLSLMYVFLHFQTLPSFVYSFMYNLVKVFYVRDTLPNKIKQHLNKNYNQPIFDYEKQIKSQKIPMLKKQKNWFNFVKISSKFITNNLASLIIFSLFIFRNVVIKLLIVILPTKYAQILMISKFRLLRKASAQLICSAPFFIVSAVHNFLQTGESTFVGLFNNFLQVFICATLILIPIAQYIWCINLVTKFNFMKNYLVVIQPYYYYFQQIKINESTVYKQKYHQMQTKWIDYNIAKSKERLLFWGLCIFIPALTVARSHLGFFLVVSPIVYFRLRVIQSHFHVYSLPQKMLKLLSSFIWIIYHTSYIFIYLLQILLDSLQNNEGNLKFIILAAKYIGLITIICLMLGGIVDLMNLLYKIMLILIFVCLVIVKKIKNKQNVVQNIDLKLKQDLVNKRKQQLYNRFMDFSNHKFSKPYANNMDVKLKKNIKSRLITQRICESKILQKQNRKISFQDEPKKYKIVVFTQNNEQMAKSNEENKKCDNRDILNDRKKIKKAIFKFFQRNQDEQEINKSINTCIKKMEQKANNNKIQQQNYLLKHNHQK